MRAEAQRAEAQFEQILGSVSNIRIIAARELETSDREVGREGGRPSCQMAEDLRDGGCSAGQHRGLKTTHRNHRLGPGIQVITSLSIQ